jgi:8-amino-3,8-dideoxy-alpha-D-manno-octulosonate transaminase
MSEKGIGTKNVPDAIEWHFAKYWDHIYSQLGYTSTTFDQKFRISTDLLARSVALPIMVKMPADLIETRIRDLVLILKSLD